MLINDPKQKKNYKLIKKLKKQLKEYQNDNLLTKGKKQ